MKKILLSILLAVFTVTAYSQEYGKGWNSVRGKQNYKDSINYMKAVRFRANVNFDNSTSIGTMVPLNSDTTTIFVWDVGIGTAGDTACFRTFTKHGYSYGSFKWEGSDTLVVTKLIGWVSSGGSVAVQVSWDANNEDATPTNLNTSAPTITSSTTGDADTSFDNATIPPGVWVWLTTPTVTTQPKKLRVSLIGYKRNRSY